MESIPFRNNAQFREEIELDGTSYILAFKWNALNEYWSMNILDRDENPIALGLKIVTQWNITGQIIQTGMPLGDILCQNIVGGFEKIQRYDVGETNELVYYEEGTLTS